MKTLKRAVWLSLMWTCTFGLPSGVSGQTAPEPTEQSRPATERVPLNADGDSSPRIPPASLSGLFKDTVGDFRRLSSRESLTWLGVGVAAAALTHPADHRVSDALSASPRLDDVFEPGKTIGGARFQMGSAAAVFALGRLTRSSRVSLVGADLLRAQFLAQAVTAAVKVSVRRDRPDGTQYSFPSGHSSVTFASATVLQRHFGWKVGVPAYGLATYVAASRINEKRHFLSDVAFGAAVGIVAGRTVTVGRSNARFALGPMVGPGGVGVSLNWLGSK